MKAWWDSLQERERRTLMIGGGALIVILFYFMIWLPGHQGAEQLERDVVEARLLHTFMQQAHREAQTFGGSTQQTPNANGSGQGLFALADQSARQAGLGNAIRRVEPSGENRVRVNLENAGFDDTIDWLVTLHARHGISVDNLTVRTGDAPGRVNVQMQLEGAD